MGRLNVDTLRTNSGRTILADSGNIVSMTWVWFAEYTNFEAPTSGNGNTLYPLMMAVGVQRTGNKLIFEYMLGGEAHQDTSFVMQKGTTDDFEDDPTGLPIITDSGQEGYNSDSGNNRWSSIISGWYDQNNDTTPSNMRMTFHYTPPDTNQYIYAPGVRSSSGTVREYRMNRYYSTADERNTSFGICYEIAG